MFRIDTLPTVFVCLMLWTVKSIELRDVCMQNPFEHLYRDHDIEGMSDG